MRECVCLYVQVYNKMHESILYPIYTTHTCVHMYKVRYITYMHACWHKHNGECIDILVNPYLPLYWELEMHGWRWDKTWRAVERSFAVSYWQRLWKSLFNEVGLARDGTWVMGEIEMCWAPQPTETRCLGGNTWEGAVYFRSISQDPSYSIIESDPVTS